MIGAFLPASRVVCVGESGIQTEPIRTRLLAFPAIEFVLSMNSEKLNLGRPEGPSENGRRKKRETKWFVNPEIAQTAKSDIYYTNNFNSLRGA
jgi:hypothetical protein